MSWNSGIRSCTYQPYPFKWRIVGTATSEVFVGMLNVSPEAVVVTEQSLAIKTRSANVRRIVESGRWDVD